MPPASLHPVLILSGLFLPVNGQFDLQFIQQDPISLAASSGGRRFSLRSLWWLDVIIYHTHKHTVHTLTHTLAQSLGAACC